MLTTQHSIVPIHTLLPHEEIFPQRLTALITQLQSDGILQRAIVVDRNTHIILDGHHRWNAILQLGLTSIPALLLDIWHQDICIERFRDDINVSKELVLECGRTQELLPARTTRHLYGPQRIPISEAFDPVHVPLASLQ